jgi:hypothetical protein
MCDLIPLYVCVLSLTVYFTFFSFGSSLNIRDRACAILTLVGIARDTDVCVLVRACVCLFVCVCVCICTHFLYVSFRHLCMCHQPFSPRYEVYICPRPATFLTVICTNEVSLYRHICAAKRRYCEHGSLW